MKTILFTGARSGIAHATIKRLINKDYLIYVTVHTEKQLELIKQTYSDYNNVKCLKIDITNKEDLKVIEGLDIDILVSNAAIGESGSIAEIDMDKVRYNYEVNVFSNFRVVQIVLENMMKKQSGKIIMMSSLFAHLPVDFLGVYCSTKSSISILTTTLHNELKLLNNNIKIVLIEPGSYHTGFNQVMLENKYEWMYKKSYFDKEIDLIRKKENIMISLIEKTKLDSIVNKIVKAITKENPKFRYRAPFSHALFVKLYNFFKN